jgi:hypothetical protein
VTRGSIPSLPGLCGSCRATGVRSVSGPHAADPLEDGAVRCSWKCWRCGHQWQDAVPAGALAGPPVQVITELDAAFARGSDPFTGHDCPEDHDGAASLASAWALEGCAIGEGRGWEITGLVALEFGGTNIRAGMSPAAARDLARLLAEAADAAGQADGAA